MFPRQLANRWVDGVEAELVQDLPLDVRHQIGANQPPKAKRVFKRTCPETGIEFETTGKDRMFATDQDKSNFHNRSSSIGRKLVPLAMAWRAGRNAKGQAPVARARRASAAKAFAEMCRLLDAAAADDRDAGRMPKLEYVRRRDAVAGQIGACETVGYQAKLIAATAVVRAQLGKAADDLTVRELDGVAAIEVKRQARVEKLALLAAMGVKS